MITLLSPAKKISKDCSALSENYKEPQFLDKAKILVDRLKRLDLLDYMSLMNISESLAMLNWERMQNWDTDFKSYNSREAIYSFAGDTYTGLDASSLTEKNLLFADSNIRILSGLYGILRPLDLIKPYRLEMGTKFGSENSRNLYEFWDETLENSIIEDLKNHKSQTVINCASIEYFKSVKKIDLKAKIITPQFKDWKNGKFKIISFYAKKARGMMARFIIKNKLVDEGDILDFNYGGYSFDESTSTPSEPVFTRNQN